jgi:hypothetical protein
MVLRGIRKVMILGPRAVPELPRKRRLPSLGERWAREPVQVANRTERGVHVLGVEGRCFPRDGFLHDDPVITDSEHRISPYIITTCRYHGIYLGGFVVAIWQLNCLDSVRMAEIQR